VSLAILSSDGCSRNVLLDMLHELLSRIVVNVGEDVGLKTDVLDQTFRDLHIAHFNDNCIVAIPWCT
jgi:hypothetical protein